MNECTTYPGGPYTAQRQMPQYQCHKKVWALKIASIFYDDGGPWIQPEDEGFAPISVSQSWVEKHSPQAGGYYVQYKDGYVSFSPAQAFEEGYSAIA